MGYATITKSGPLGWSSSAWSAVKYQSEEFHEVTIVVDADAATKARAFGFEHADPPDVEGFDDSITTLDFAWEINPDGPGARVIEHGSGKTAWFTISQGDILKITIDEIDLVRYYINGDLKYTTVQLPLFPQYLKVAIFHTGAKVDNFQIDGNQPVMATSTIANVPHHTADMAITYTGLYVPNKALALRFMDSQLVPNHGGPAGTWKGTANLQSISGFPTLKFEEALIPSGLSTTTWRFRRVKTDVVTLGYNPNSIEVRPFAKSDVEYFQPMLKIHYNMLGIVPCDYVFEQIDAYEGEAEGFEFFPLQAPDYLRAGDKEVLGIDPGCNNFEYIKKALAFATVRRSDRDPVPTTFLARVYRKSIDGIKPRILLTATDRNSNPRLATGLGMASFRIPQDDPQFDRLEDPGSGFGYRLQHRYWIYDAALAVFSYVLDGQTSRARDILDRIWVEQETSGDDIFDSVPGKLYPFPGGNIEVGGVDHIFRPRGSLPFSCDYYIGLEFTPPYLRTGANAWLLAAACFYMIKTGTTTYLTQCRLLADWMLLLQVTDPADARYGLFTGGEGSFAGDSYKFTFGSRTWCSTEHNLDCYMAYRYMYQVDRQDKYKQAFELCKDGLMTKAYIPSENRFAQGVHAVPDMGTPSNIDREYALDCFSWGGLFLTSIGEWGKAEAMYNQLFTQYEPGKYFFYNQNKTIIVDANPLNVNTYNAKIAAPLGETYNGFMPFFDSFDFTGGINTLYHYPPPHNNIWPEGTWGVIMLGKRLGKDVSDLEDSMARLARIPECYGGPPAYTSTDSPLPYEQHVWPAIAGAAWQVITQLDPFTAVWPVGVDSDLRAISYTQHSIKPIATILRLSGSA